MNYRDWTTETNELQRLNYRDKQITETELQRQMNYNE